MSSINRVRKLRILYFSRKRKKLKNLKNGEKCLVLNPHVYVPVSYTLDILERALTGLELL